MAKADIWMPLFIGDYLADTSRLTTEQHGAYLLLIMDYWRNGPPPDDEHVLAQIARLNLDAWSIAQAQLKHFFSIENGVWRHKRIDEELAAAAENKGKAQAKAKAAASARWNKEQNHAPSNAPSTPQAMHEECPSPSPSPSLKTKSKTEPRGTRLASDWIAPDEYLEFCRKERPDLNPLFMQDKFRDYWHPKPGKDGLKLDWFGTWRNFIRSERQPLARASPGYQTQNDKAKALADRLTGRARNEQSSLIIDIE